MAEIKEIQKSQNNVVVTLQCPAAWMKYFLAKGFVAIDGVSLTVVEVNPEGFFTVSLIPETLRVTRWKNRRSGDRVNIELDSQTQAIVETVERSNPGEVWGILRRVVGTHLGVDPDSLTQETRFIEDLGF